MRVSSSSKDGNQIPWVVFRKGDRKLEVIRPYLDAAERAGRSEVVAIGEAREFQWVFDAAKKDGPDGVPWFRFCRTERLVTCYYFYIHDRRIGPAFIKVCCRPVGVPVLNRGAAGGGSSARLCAGTPGRCGRSGGAAPVPRSR